MNHHVYLFVFISMQDELSAASCGVVVVTFGEMSGAERWLQETKCPFPYYRDPTRALYHHLGLRRYGIYLICIYMSWSLEYIYI